MPANCHIDTNKKYLRYAWQESSRFEYCKSAPHYNCKYPYSYNCKDLNHVLTARLGHATPRRHWATLQAHHECPSRILCTAFP